MRHAAALLCLATTLGAASQEPDLPGYSAEDLRHARTFAQNSGLAAPLIDRMQALLGQGDRWQHFGTPRPDMQLVAPLLINWIQGSRYLPPDRQADALYAADILLGLLPLNIERQPGTPPSRASLDERTAGLRAKLATVGANFSYDELGDAYEYNRDWMQKAFRVAPDSEAGQRAFLILLDKAFHPGCCCGGGFEDVIAQAPRILKQHPHWAIRPQVLLAIGDAYRDIIAIANGASPYASDDDARYKPQVPHARREALRYYRAVVAAAPHSDSAREALKKARDLQAGIIPRDTRFLCIYD